MMTLFEIADWCVRGVIGLLGGAALYKFKAAEKRRDQAISKDEARQLIVDLLEPVKVDQKHTREDVTEIKTDLKEVKILLIKRNQ